MAVISSHMSDRALALLRTFRSAFAALDDHKSHPERDQIYALIASHLRSASPMSMGAADLIEPLPEVVQPLSDGARYELRIIDEKLNLYVMDALQHDCDVGLTTGQAEQLRRDIARVMGSR